MVLLRVALLATGAAAYSGYGGPAHQCSENEMIYLRSDSLLWVSLELAFSLADSA